MTDKLKKRKPVLAALMSLLSTGMGQLYNGQLSKGILLIAVTLSPYIFMVAFSRALLSVQGVFVLYAAIPIFIAIWIFAIVDAFLVARRLRAIELRRFNRWYVYLSIYLLTIIIPSVLDASFDRRVLAFSIPSGAMTPTLLEGDYVIVDSDAYADNNPQRGDIVVFRKPPENAIDYIKRVVGLPGDRIQVIDGVLNINGEAVNREETADFVDDTGRVFTQYVETLPEGRQHRILEMLGDAGVMDNTRLFTVPPESYFVMGDNRDNSSDSRVIGFVPARNLVGKAHIIFYSTGGNVPLWQLWLWPSVIRYERIGQFVD